MNKVNGANSQAMPLWERQKGQRGHYSSVDKALQAHRQRKAERHERVEQRLDMVKNIQTQFFPTPQAAERPAMIEENFQNQPVNNAQLAQNPVDINNVILKEAPLETPSFSPMEMDEIYSEASLASVADNAMGVVQKEIANPEEVPSDEVPKGSYVDYTV